MIDFMSFEEFEDQVAAADTVVTHGGIGSILLALAHGKRTIVMPRRHALGECVDDHQLAFAQRLAAEGVVTLATDEESLRLAFTIDKPTQAANRAARGAQAGRSPTSDLVPALAELLR
jgi:UDP-N-acetylglucosamine transferase subunit ALG13